MPDEQNGEHWILAEIGKNPKQLDIFNCNTEEDDFAQFILVDGGRLNGKTLGVAHRIWRHLWEIPGARVGLVSKTYKTAKQGGAWADLTEVVGPKWLQSGMVGDTNQPIEYTSRNASGPGPAVDPLTRTPYFRIRNMYGGESECLLISLDNDSADEVEAKLKSTRFSLIWFSELSTFSSRVVFNLSIMQLRMPHLRPEQHLWIADTNPPEEGKQAWFYKLWYEEMLAEDHPEPLFQKKMRHIHVRLEDNMAYLSPIQVAMLKGTYAHDPGEYARHVDGQYVAGHGTIDKHFADLIIPEIHFLEGPIEVENITTELFTGWDLGQVNHAAVILEKRIIGDESYWMVLDEEVVVGVEMTTAEFAYRVYEKIQAIERFYRRNFQWTHWSDDTALNMYRAQTGGFDAGEVLKATEGQVNLLAAAKPDGSVGDGIRILRRLLSSQRLFVGSNCPKIQEMLKDLRKTDDPRKQVADGPLKHPFDALRYPIYMEERAKLIASLPKSSNRGLLIHA